MPGSAGATGFARRADRSYHRRTRIRRYPLSALVALAFVLPASAHAHHYSPHACQRTCQVRVYRHLCSNSRPRACVERAIAQYRFTGWRAAWMRRIPGCESGWDPAAYNPSDASGLYQFMPGTWAATPYGRHSVWEAKWQALAAAWMLTRGRAGEWVCR